MSANPGYAGKIARVDLSTGVVSHIPTESYAEAFVGGQGIAAKIYWDEVPPQVQALDPENRLIFATGPCAGFPRLSGARWVVCSKSPATTPQFFTSCNLGGSWGTELKAAGFDGLVVQGKAERPAYLLIQDGAITIADATNLWGKGSMQVREIIKGERGSAFKVVASGPAGDNIAVQAILLADGDAAGAGGLGAVMGAKKLKAIAVRGSGSIDAAHPRRLQELLDYAEVLSRGAPAVESEGREVVEKDHCAGCTVECNRNIYQAKDGQKGKFMCQPATMYTPWAMPYYKQANDVPFYATKLCDDYGLHTKSIAAIISWLNRCHKEGILTDNNVNLPLSKIGSLEFIQALTASIAHRQGFGELLAQGIQQAAASVGNRAVELLYDNSANITAGLTKQGEMMAYQPRTFITTAIFYAMEPRQPIQQLHEVSRLSRQWLQWAKKMPQANLSSAVWRAIAKRFWGSELAVDYSTYEGKALAAKMIQDRQLARECLVLCDHQFPIYYVEHSSDHVGDPSLESKIVSAITGTERTEEELYKIGERLMNLQRAIRTREGHQGRESDVLPEGCFTIPLDKEQINPEVMLPGKNGEIISRKGTMLDKAKFHKMLGEYYKLRGWDQESGLQQKAQLEGLGLSDVAHDLSKRRLLK
ncbi:MAG: hypothetical protein HYX81_02320 [Chloroflexi bacterium]|nr:hypothetical protein [Chloroflexota bacterium]